MDKNYVIADILASVKASYRIILLDHLKKFGEDSFIEKFKDKDWPRYWYRND